MRTPEEFWAKVDRSAQCWIWVGAASDGGYGSVSWEGRTRGAHRVAYQLVVGPIPPGMQLDHLCRIPACVNPAHLEVVTNQENQLRGRQGFSLTGKCRSGRHPIKSESDWVIIKGAKGNGRHCRACRDEKNARRSQRDGEVA